MTWHLSKIVSSTERICPICDNKFYGYGGQKYCCLDCSIEAGYVADKLNKERYKFKGPVAKR